MTQTQAPEIALRIPKMRLQITAALFDGRVSIDGVQLEPADVPPAVYDEVPELRDGTFGLCDLNVGYWLPAIEAGWEIIAIPVFTLRASAHQNIYVRADRGIDSPADLAGRTIAARTFRTGSTIWTRGLLQHRYGVDPYSLRWYTQMNETFPVYDDKVQRDPGDSRRKHPLDSLLDGDVDAGIAAILPPRNYEAWQADPRVKQLFTDYMAEDERLFDDTGIVRAGRVLVMSKKLDAQHPGLARKIYDAFDRAKELAYRELRGDGMAPPLLFFRELLHNQKARYGDPWVYGIQANRAGIDTFIQYNQEQGLVRSPFSYEQIFARSTLDT